MAGYPRYDATKPTKDPDDMSDAELQETMDDLKDDIKDAEGMAYQLTEDIKTRKRILKIYRSFWKIREEGRMPIVPYVRRWYSMTLYQKAIPWLSPGIYDMGPFGELRVLPNPPRSYMEKWWGEIWEWMMTPGPYVD